MTAHITTAQPWVEQAACRTDPDAWTGDVPFDVRIESIKTCRFSCPVVTQCAIAGRGESWGIWGGVDKQARATSDWRKREDET